MVMRRNVLSIIVCAIIATMIMPCSAENMENMISYEETDVFENGHLNGNYTDLGEKDGYITTIDDQKFYINDYKRYYGFQEIYSMDVFNFFKDTFSDLFQYVKTSDGYIVCEPAYRINLQNIGWTGGSRTVYLYDSDLKLTDSVTFSDAVYSVDYINNEYMVQFVDSDTNGKNIVHTYKKSKDFQNWEDCEDLRKVNDVDILYENGASVRYSEKFSPCTRLGGFYITYSATTGKRYVSADGIYSIELPVKGYNYCEDDFYLYCSSGGEIVKMPKEPFYNTLKEIASRPKIKYNNKILAFEQPPVIQDDRTLIPLRFLFEQMGAEVTWNQEEQTATITQNDTAITVGIDDTEAEVNGQTVSMDVPAQLINDKTMVPVRFLSEELGYDVSWDGENRIITIE